MLKPVKPAPPIAIGFPVYNGAKYLGPAIDSILAQTFTEFRLIIGDNHSSDDTEEICREYARRDSRIAFYRRSENLGVARNFNLVCQPSGSPFFKWAAHDDVLEPTYLERCLDLVQTDSSLACAHSLTFEIDATGARVRPYDEDIRLCASSPSKRLWRVLWVRHFTETFGVMRSDTIRNTHMHGGYVASDRNFMAEIALLGNIGYVEEYLFNRRTHPDSYMGGGVGGKQSQVKWFDTSARVPVVPVGLVNLREYVRSVLTLPLPFSERAACMKVILEWGARRSLERALRRGDHHRDVVADSCTSS